jgi:hypothetical protein
VLLWHVDRLAQVSPLCTLPGTALGCWSIRAFMQGSACMSSTCSLQAVGAKLEGSGPCASSAVVWHVGVIQQGCKSTHMLMG